MAFHIISRAYEKGELKKDMPIYEATSGNTGISVAAIGRSLGHKVKIFMPDWMSDERKNLIRSLGADIQLVSKEEGGFLYVETPGWHKVLFWPLCLSIIGLGLWAFLEG